MQHRTNYRAPTTCIGLQQHTPHLPSISRQLAFTCTFHSSSALSSAQKLHFTSRLHVHIHLHFHHYILSICIPRIATLCPTDTRQHHSRTFHCTLHHFCVDLTSFYHSARVRYVSHAHLQLLKHNVDADGAHITQRLKTMNLPHTHALTCCKPLTTEGAST